MTNSWKSFPIGSCASGPLGQMDHVHLKGQSDCSSLMALGLSSLGHSLREKSEMNQALQPSPLEVLMGPQGTQPPRQLFRLSEETALEAAFLTLLGAPQGAGQIPPCFQGQGTTGSWEQQDTHLSVHKHVAPHAADSATWKEMGTSPMRPHSKGHRH